MGFIHDNKVPVDLPQARQDLRPLGKVEGRDDLVLFQPLVDAELIADIAAFEDKELLVEFLFQLTLPLERVV